VKFGIILRLRTNILDSKESKTAIVIHIMKCYQDKLILNFDISNWDY